MAQIVLYGMVGNRTQYMNIINAINVNKFVFILFWCSGDFMAF